MRTGKNNNNAYNGNVLLKKDGVKIEWTPDLIKEYKKCKNDPIYFISKYCKIITLDHGLQLFKPYEYQKRMVKAFVNNRFIINLLPRQMGKTVICAAYLLHYAVFNKDKSIGILANKAAVAREILARVQRMYEYLPDWLQVGVRSWNKGSMELSNNSTIMAAATSSDSVRGFSFNLIMLDEFAHVQNASTFYESTYPVISSGIDSKVIICSTPNGMNLFWKIFSEAEQKKNTFVPIRVTWDEHPKRNQKWKDETLKNIGIEQFSQEFDCEFLGSSGSLISGWKLKELVAQIPIQSHEGLTQFQPCDGNHVYAIIADVSRGKGLDYSAFSVIDITAMPYQQVCTFKNNMITPTDYAEIIFRIAKMYNSALVLVEINDIGEQVACLLHDEFEYEGVLTTESGGREGRRISSRWNQQVDKGIRTTTQVKSVGCSMLKLLVEQNQLILNDEATISELSTFSKKGRSYEAEPGCHDDLVMGLVLFGWLSSQSYFKELTNTDTLKMLRDRTQEEISNNMMPFGIFNNGIDTIFFDDDTNEQFFSKWLTDPESYEKQKKYNVVTERSDAEQEAEFNNWLRG